MTSPFSTEPAAPAADLSAADTGGDFETTGGRAEVAAALRRLHHALVGHDNDPTLLATIADQFNDAASILEAGPRRSRAAWTGRDASGIPADGSAFALDFDRPVSGPGNPWSLPSPITRDGDRAVTTVVLAQGYEGAPGRSHGGIVAAIYDDLCGYNLVLEAVLAFTGWIRIDYRAATPLNEPITFATWVGTDEGRKMQILGECRLADGTLLSTCDSLFIKVEPEPIAT